MYESGHKEVRALGPAVVLVHGFNGGPLDMHELDERLRAEGFGTRNLLLPGHGSGARALARTTWNDWTQAVLDTVAEMKARHSSVVLVGHSMGAALALHAAANTPELAGVVALCPPLRMFFGEARAAALVRRVAPYLPSLREDIYDPEARRQYRRSGSRWTPLEAAHSLLSALPALRAQLGSVTCPTLVMCARKDHVVPMRDGIEVFNLLGTSAKELHVLQRSYHVVTKDVEREIVAHQVTDFAMRVSGQGSVPHATVQRDLAGDGFPVPGITQSRQGPIARLDGSNRSPRSRARSAAHLMSFVWRVGMGARGVRAGRLA